MAARRWTARGTTRPAVIGLALAVAGAGLLTEARAVTPATPPGGTPVQNGMAKSPAPPDAGPARPPQGQGQGQGQRPAGSSIAFSPEDAARTPPLEADRPVQVTLRRGQQAFFRVSPAAGGAWAVTTRRLGRNTDTVLAALDERGEAVVEDDDGGQESLASRIEVQPDDGARLVRAGVLEDGGGRFEVLLTREAVLPPPDFATRREDAASRPPLEIGKPVSIRLRRNQEAFFRLPDDRTNLVAVTRELSQGTDTTLALLDASGNVLAENDDSANGLASLLPVARAADGPLTLRANLLGGTGRFVLALEREEPVPPPNYPVDLEQARAREPIGAGTTLRIEMGRDGQAIFALPENQTLSILTRNLSGDVDTVLALLDENGQTVAEDDDGGGGLASRVSTAVASRPARFVRASLLNSARGSFDLVVQEAGAVQGGPSGSLAEAARRPSLILGEAVRVRIGSGGSAFIALPNDGRPAQAMTFDLGTDADTVLTLVDENGAELGENDDAEGLASRLDIPPVPRPAFLRMKLVDDREGEFSLVLIRPTP